MAKEELAPTFTVEQLLRSPGLELSVLVGHTGLSRTVSWAHVSELEDPTPWLLGGELIMTTGIALPRSAGGQLKYLERLDRAGVAALALSDGLTTPPLSRAFLAAAEERGFPVLEVPLPVPFISVVRVVAAAVQVATNAQMNAQIQVFGTLRDLAFHEATPGQVFRRLEATLGYSLYLCSSSGAQLLQEVPVPPSDLVHLVPESPRQAPTVDGGYALPVPSSAGSEGYLLAVPTPRADTTNLAALQSVAIVAAFLLNVRRQLEEVTRRQGAETLAELLAGGLNQAAVQRHLAALGLDPAERYRLWAVDSGQVASSDALATKLRERNVNHLILSQRAHDFVLCPDSETVTEAIQSIDGIRAGNSRPLRVSPQLALSRAEAVWALNRAIETRRAIYAFDGEDTDQWLTQDRAALSELVDRCLGSVIAYDQTHRTNLLDTVRVWLDNDRGTAEVARQLLLHPNTLTYRLKRFEKISGKRLSRTGDASEVWLALRALSRGNGPRRT